MFKGLWLRGRGLFWRLALATAGLQGVLCCAPQAVVAAERIVVSYNILERSISIDDLQNFADTGELSPQLREYAGILGLDKEQLESIATLLTTPADLGVVAVSQFLYTAQGKLLLKQVSEVIQTPSRQAGFSATRAALILAAADPEPGLTILNFLRKYPSEVIRIDVGRGLALAQEINRAILQSEQAIDLVQREARAQVSANPLGDEDFALALSLLRNVRRYEPIVTELKVPELSVPVRLLLPQRSSIEVLPPRNVPLIVVSHGLGSNRETYRYLGETLAQAGFVVAMIEHTGSNDRQLLNLQEGLVDAVVEDVEFIRRPLEVSWTLDAIAQATRTGALRGLVNLREIGLIGQSFGGYTALAAAGADFSSEAFDQSCPPQPPVFNLSLLLQCQASLLDETVNSFVDPRIDAVFAMNPIGSALFGPQGYGQISQPLMIVSGTADTIAPAFPEQIRPFSWLQGNDQYLLLLSGGTHFSVIGAPPTSNQPIPVPPQIIGPQPELAQFYMETYALAFFQRYLNQDLQFQPLLTSAFTQRLSQEPIPISLIDSLSPAQIDRALQKEAISGAKIRVMAAP